MDSIQKLLKEITLISNKHDQIDQSTGRCFNVFDITNISDKEVQLCKVIYELINPNGSHYQRGKYLKLFCETVLGIDVTIDICNTAKVDRERVIYKDRRIDLYIEIADKKIPIEAKIYAGDQKRQCKDYFNYAKNSPIYYLTSDGHEPSPDSRVDLTDEQLTCISFETHILQWLGECLKDKETIKLSPIREILLQFEIVIRNLTGQMEEDKAMSIKDVLVQSSENMKSAFEIANSLEPAKLYMLQTVFEDIEKELDKIGWKICSPYYNYKSQINKFYRKSESSYPGINYFYKDAGKPNVDLWLRIEVNHRLFVGFCVAEAGEDNGNVLTETELKALLPNLKAKVEDDSWFAYWEYLPNGGNDKTNISTATPNFKNPDEGFFKLFDTNYRKKFINDCVNRIKDLMEQANVN